MVPVFPLYHLAYGFWGYYPDRLGLSAVIDQLFVTGPIEEFSKFIVFFLLSRRLRSLREPLDGLLQAAAVALAFATAENIKYTFEYGLLIIPLRAALSTGGHLFYAAIWGYIYAAVVYPSPGDNPRPELRLAFLALAPAAIIHALYNMLVLAGHPGAGILVDLVALGLAVVIYRCLLRVSPYAAVRNLAPARALEQTSLALLWNPGSPCLHHRASLLRLQRAEYDQALVHLHACLSTRPGHPYYLCLRGVAQLAAGQTEEGAAVIETSWPKLPKDNRRALVTNARTVLGAGRAPAALPEAGEVRERFPHTYEVLQRITARRVLPTPRTGQRIPLTRWRYLVRVA
jgi:hypothetical protein